MKIVLASYGSRGDVEPVLAVGRELLRRGHDVRIAVAPDLVGFVESAGLSAVAYGLDTRRWLDGQRDFSTSLFRRFWKIGDLIRMARRDRRLFTQSWEEISATLMSLAEGADLLVTGHAFEGPAANVAEYYDIPTGYAAFLPAAGQRPVHALPAGVGPFRRDGVRLAVLALLEEGRGRAAP